MSLLRDDRMVTLHDLVEACRASSQHCLLAAELMPEDRRAASLRCLGERRAADADFFGERMVAEGDIPGGPPAELSFIETALARARAAFADEGFDALLADCRERELAVLKEAEAACHGPLRDDEKATAKELAGNAAEQLDTLFKR